jgi:hypothetical protein
MPTANAIVAVVVVTMVNFSKSTLSRSSSLRPAQRLAVNLSECMALGPSSPKVDRGMAVIADNVAASSFADVAVVVGSTKTNSFQYTTASKALTAQLFQISQIYCCIYHCLLKNPQGMSETFFFLLFFLFRSFHFEISL